MSHRIFILPENLTNKIAAGEVVERPASVVKELVENSIDAGATDISVEITTGGKRLIRVTDNGTGMSREDALLSLERHATSKIRTDDDLDKIETLGFRGEALPSVASVSRFSIATREVGSSEGVEVSVEGGRVRDVKACGMPTGTVIKVEQLFFNLPARNKFLKSTETEAGHVADVIARMAVSRPDVAFSCISDGRELLKLQRSNLQRRITQVVGAESSQHLYPVQCDGDEISIDGYVSSPSLVRSGTQAIYTYINGRFIRDKVVQHAVMQAYRGVIDRGRYPVLALFINIPYGEVDVNVHPTKHEVRFRRQAVVHDAIQKGIESVLRSSPWLIKQDVSFKPPPKSSGVAYKERIAAAAQASLSLPVKAYYPAQITEQKSILPLNMPSATSVQPETVSETVSAFQPTQLTNKSPGYFSSLSIIGQFHNEYILCQSGAEMVIIDQHAASERVAYQILVEQNATGGIESQRLLFPETVEVSFSEVAAVARHTKDLAAIGFELEPFGGATLLMSAVPRIAAAGKPVKLLRDVLADLEAIGTSTAFNSVIENVLSRIACHSVIRGTHSLDHQQIRELLHSMDRTDFAASCPHGRPVSHVISLSELQKIFKRT